LAIFGAGAAIGVASVWLWSVERSFRWIDLTVAQDGGTPFALFSAHGHRPDIPRFIGKVKFLRSGRSGVGSVNLGYFLQPEGPGSDLSGIRKDGRDANTSEPPSHHPSGDTTQVMYEVEFDFDLRDADGFVLKTVASPKERIWTGTKREIQNVVAEAIPTEVVARTRTVVLRRNLLECAINCDDD
jgi:hypothetical protein